LGTAHIAALLQHDRNMANPACVSMEKHKPLETLGINAESAIGPANGSISAA